MISWLILVALIVAGSYVVGSARGLLKEQPIACNSAADLARMLETSELDVREASEVKRRIGQIVLRRVPVVSRKMNSARQTIMGVKGPT